MAQRVDIVFYSGTGCAERVAVAFADAWTVQGAEVCLKTLSRASDAGVLSFQPRVHVGGCSSAWNAPGGRTGNVDSGSHPQGNGVSAPEMLVLVYAVHACNAPEPVYQWLDQLSVVSGTPAVVVSVSGGGEVSPNTACRNSSIRRLKRKGYRVVHEDMIVMPSNWIVDTKLPLAVKLLEILPERVERIVGDVAAGRERHMRSSWWDPLLSRMGELEKYGARQFGRYIRCGAACTGCGWCVRHCPVGNIALREKRPTFGKGCNMCLKCIYGCPVKALKPGVGKFVAISKGFSLQEIEGQAPWQEPVDVRTLATGYLWKGVREYLLEEGPNR